MSERTRIDVRTPPVSRHRSYCPECRHSVGLHAPYCLATVQYAGDADVVTCGCEPVERGWVCPDGADHYWTEVTVGDRTVDERCDRCGALKSEDVR